MSLLTAADPHLSALKIVCMSIEDDDYDMGRQIGSARYSLYKAIVSGDVELALGWLNTLDVALGFLEKDGHPSSESVAIALSELRDLLRFEVAP